MAKLHHQLDHKLLQVSWCHTLHNFCTQQFFRPPLLAWNWLAFQLGIWLDLLNLSYTYI